jgi:hypothetical protein
MGAGRRADEQGIDAWIDDECVIVITNGQAADAGRQARGSRQIGIANGHKLSLWYMVCQNLRPQGTDPAGTDDTDP